MNKCPKEFTLYWLNKELSNDERFVHEALVMLREWSAANQPEHARSTYSPARSADALVNFWLTRKRLFGYSYGDRIENYLSLTIIAPDDDLERGIQNQEAMITMKRDEIVALMVEEGVTIPACLQPGPRTLTAHTVAPAMGLSDESCVENKLVLPLGSADVLKKRERQILALEAAVLAFGYPVLAIPQGGKKKLMLKCKEAWPDLFSGGDDPFLGAWKAALKDKRVRTADHNKYVGGRVKTP